MLNFVSPPSDDRSCYVHSNLLRNPFIQIKIIQICQSLLNNSLTFKDLYHSLKLSPPQLTLEVFVRDIWDPYTQEVTDGFKISSLFASLSSKAVLCQPDDDDNKETRIETCTECLGLHGQLPLTLTSAALNNVNSDYDSVRNQGEGSLHQMRWIDHERRDVGFLSDRPGRRGGKVNCGRGLNDCYSSIGNTSELLGASGVNMLARSHQPSCNYGSGLAYFACGLGITLWLGTGYMNREYQGVDVLLLKDGQPLLLQAKNFSGMHQEWRNNPENVS
jgi:hypothetical protein